MFEGSYLGDNSRVRDDTRLECGICWWVYDPTEGDELGDVPAGTPFSSLPANWTCPNCEAPRLKFLVIGD